MTVSRCRGAVHCGSSLLLGLLLSAAAAWADIVSLKGGGCMEGEVQEQGDVYVIRKGESAVRIPKAMVISVQRQKSVQNEYTKRLAALDRSNPKASYEFGLWCAANGLPVEARSAFGAVLIWEPNHAGARQQLGFKQIDGIWHRCCATCSGSGHVVCTTCNGVGAARKLCPNAECRGGRLRCAKCEGVGKFRCERCGGSGDIRCANCRGDGRTWSGRVRHVCPVCSGKGRVDCPACVGGMIVCAACRGTGTVQCDQCKGTGYRIVPCPDCREAKRQPCADCKGKGLVPDGKPSADPPEKETARDQDSRESPPASEPAEPSRRGRRGRDR